ncbi:MAG: MqnA/MqnD/SBP family protein [Chlorobiota bacterium]
MKLKIAIPDNPIYRQIFFNAESVCKEFGATLIKTNEREVAKLFEENKVDVAFLTPKDYGRGTRISDYRIVPTTCLAVEGYSRYASVYFKQGLQTIKSAASPTPDDFIINIGKILLAERYSISVDLEKTDKSKVDDILEEKDAALIWKKNFLGDVAMDITEDWFDSYRIPLVLGTWVVRHQEEPEALDKMLKLFESDSLHGKTTVTDKPGEEMEPREGKLIHEWSDEIEKAYDTLLEILFYHQFTNELATVKMMGDEIGSPTEDSAMFNLDKKEDENR